LVSHWRDFLGYAEETIEASRWSGSPVSRRSFFLLVFEMIEFRQTVMVRQALTRASREGTRIDILDGATTADATDAANARLQNAPVPGATVTVTPNPPKSAGYGAPVMVAGPVSFNQVSCSPSPMFLGGMTRSASTVIRRGTIQ
jgi:hypothetical protein